MDDAGTSGTTNQVSGHSFAKLKQAMPKSSPLKVKVLSALVKSLSPSMKKNILLMLEGNCL